MYTSGNSYHKGNKQKPDYDLKSIFRDFRSDKLDVYSDSLDKIKKLVQDMNLTTSQLRNVFNRVIREDTAMGLQRVRPLLAYLAGRNRSKGVKFFLDSLGEIIKDIRQNEEVKDFRKFLEAVICYKKYYEKK